MSAMLEEARSLAKANGWAEIDHQATIFMVSFQRGTSRVNVYYSKATVGTVVDHPRWGRNQMFRRNVHRDALRAIFENPRAHLNKDGIPGYHQNGHHISNQKRRTK